MTAIPLAKAHPPFVLALDIGTSSLRALVYDAQANPIQEFGARRCYQVETSADGGATLDPQEMFAAFTGVLDELCAQIKGRISLAAVAAASLAHNTLALDDAGNPLTPAFLYADTRNADVVERLRARYDWAPIYARTGCPLHTSYLPARLVWLRETRPDLFKRAARFLSLHEYFLWRLFGQTIQSHSFASWSGMLNHTADRAPLDWDEEVLEIAGIARTQLTPPGPIGCALQGLTGEFAARWPILARVAFFPALGDGAAANLGSGCTDATRVAVTIGTSAALRVVLPMHEAQGILPATRRLRAIGQEAHPDAPSRTQGLWCYRVDKERGLIGGSLNNGGNVFAYLAGLLQIGEYATIETELAKMAPDAHGLTLLPFFAGERSPGYRGDARAALVGWHLGTTALDLWRAAMEAICYRLALIYDLLGAAMHGHACGEITSTLVSRDHTSATAKPREIIASGAALLRSRVWCQTLADVLGTPVTVSGEEEASARGAALLALEALGVIRRAIAQNAHLDAGCAMAHRRCADELPATFGETYRPRPEYYEIYRRGLERQCRLYEVLLTGEGGNYVAAEP